MSEAKFRILQAVGMFVSFLFGWYVIAPWIRSL